MREQQTASLKSEVRRLKPGHLAQVDGLHGFFQMRLNVPPQFVRVRLFSCDARREGNRKSLLGHDKRHGETQ